MSKIKNKTNGTIDKTVFDTFFHESYCPLEYAQVKNDFLEAAAEVTDLFVDDCDPTKLTKKNFVLYMTSDAYCEFEDIVEEAFESLNPEIVDAVMDISSTTDNADEVTEQYWSTCEKLLADFLGQLFEQHIEPQLKGML